jgi:hypothetical protein
MRLRRSFGKVDKREKEVRRYLAGYSKIDRSANKIETLFHSFSFLIS